MKQYDSYLFLYFLSISYVLTDTDNHPKTSLDILPKLMTEFIPYRYDRYIFFFFSENVDVIFFRAVLNKLIEFDYYCGGENLQTLIFWGANSSDFYYFQSLDNSFDSDNVESYYSSSVTQNVTAGAVDGKDIGDVAKTLLEKTSSIAWEFSENDEAVVTKQIILATDYGTETLGSTNVTNVLIDLQSKAKVNFIAVLSNLTNATIESCFPGKLWKTFPNYLSWTPENIDPIPICGSDNGLHTTPNPQFNGDYVLAVWIFLSFEYLNGSHGKDMVANFLSQLTIRRWWNFCSQYRSVSMNVTITLSGQTNDAETVTVSCDLEDSNIHSGTICSPSEIRSWLDMTNAGVIASDTACSGLYDIFFRCVAGDSQLDKHKYLMITDLPMKCNDYNNMTSVLGNYSDFSSGAPLSVIAIDQKNDNSVARSYAPIFPATQMSNLYEVNQLSDLNSNINSTISFCISFVPRLPYETLPYHRPIWYFYLIGAFILAALISLFVAFTIIRRKRQKILKQMSEGMQIVTTTRNQYEHVVPLAETDVWEIHLHSLDVDHKTIIGRGAFSIVHLGFLHGKAPVLNVFSSIALQQYDNCEVAVKTLPQHYNESTRTMFRSEIRLMKDIGFHIHLVSMLGCNCSIERPILVMELAEQSLLNWLSKSTFLTETETNLNKTLLSLSWQISDGMNYLSLKNFVHRDLAARNVLLNKELKAMVSDFGLCRKLDHAEQVLTIPGGKLPIKWMAIESLEEQQFSTKTDVKNTNQTCPLSSWSFGVLLYEIFSLGQEPYVKVISEELLAFLLKGNRLDQPRLACEQIYSLMKQCWEVDQAHRPNFAVVQSLLEKLLEDSVANYGYLRTTEQKLAEQR